MSDENNVVPFSKDPDDEKVRRVIAEAQRLARLPRDDWQAQLSDCAKSLDIEQGELAKQIESEHKTRVIAEARRLAGLAEVDWKYQVGHGSAERLGIEPKELEQYVKAAINDRKKAAQELERGADKQRQAAEDAEEKERKDEERKRVAAERAKRAEQKKRDDERREAARKAKEKQKTFANIARLPVARHEKELARLAKRLGEDVAALREEFAEFLGVGSEPAETTEPWPEPVNIAVVLQDLGDKFSRYVVMQKHQLIAAQLWTAHTWLYDYQVPIHSPILAATSAEPNSGKSTLVVAVGRASPRFSLNIEPTGPTLYRYVDATKPTIVIQEADDLFIRKSDLKHIINAGWTRGPKIPRQVNIGGVLHTVEFDPFTPKAIDLLGHNLPRTTRTRCIELRMRPKLQTENVEQFNQLDDAEFAVLRRKLARFAADNAAALKDAKPIIPSDLINRDAANWWLLLAIAELAGGEWPKRAREAAERLTRRGRRPSEGVQLLAAFKDIFATGRKEITSESVVAELHKDPTSIWAEYKHGGPITQRQVAHLLDAFDIDPVVVHPSKRSNSSPRGYKASQFVDVLTRFLPTDPHIRTRLDAKQRKKTAKQRRAKKRSK